MLEFLDAVKRLSGGEMRDVEHRIDADSNVFRVVILGDSFMEAYQVELHESLPRRLEDELAAVFEALEADATTGDG